MEKQAFLDELRNDPTFAQEVLGLLLPYLYADLTVSTTKDSDFWGNEIFVTDSEISFSTQEAQ